MRPANDPGVDYRELVRRAYDACAAAYGASRKVEAGIEIRGLSERLEDGASVLDVGCGTGVPIARALAERYRVTGVDVSREMVRLARRNVPEGEFVCSDVMSVDFERVGSMRWLRCIRSSIFLGKSTGLCFGGFGVG